MKKKQKRQAELLERRMLEIEALEREAEIKEEKAKDVGDKNVAEQSSSLQPAPPALGPSMALGESDDEEDDEEDGEDEEEEGGERERPVRLTNHTCEFFIDLLHPGRLIISSQAESYEGISLRSV